MKEDNVKEKCGSFNKHHHHYGGGSSCAVYGLGLIGALVYYFQQPLTFQEGVMVFLKALVWPAFLIYKVFTIIKM
jgi:uncharacterized membrane protein